MKTDKFDETLRRKIESIQPVFHEEDWERFTAFAGTQVVPFWKTFWGKATLYSAGTAVVAGLISYNIIQYYAQKSLHKNIQTLHHQVDSLRLITAPAPAIATNAVPDTVYITRYLPRPAVPVEVNEPREVLANDDREQTAESPDDVLTNATKKINGEEITTTTDNAPVASNALPAKARENAPDGPKSRSSVAGRARKNSKENGDNQRGFGQNRNDTRPDFKDGSVFNDKRTTSKTQKAARINAPTTGGVATIYAEPDKPTAGNEPLIAANNLPLLVLEPLSIVGIDTNANRMAVAEPFVPLQKNTAYYEPPKPPKAPFVWPKFTLRAGGGVGLASGYVSPLFTAELFVGNRLSVTSGVRLNYFKPETFFTDEQFDKERKRDFRGTYAPKAPPMMEILNISERSYVVQVPLRLNYYQPLGRNFWLLGSVGTLIDVYGSKRVTFDLRQNRSEFERVINVATLSPVPFNNLVISTGLEKRIGRVAFQLSPYVLRQTQTVSYRSNNQSVGANFNILVKF